MVPALFPGESRGITTSLSKIEYKMWFKKKSNFFFYKLGCMILGTRREKNQWNIQKKKVFQSGKILPCGGILDLLPSWKLSRTLIFSTWCLSFWVTITVRYEESNQEDSWFLYHAHQHIHFVHFVCKTDDKILFYKIILFKKIVVLYENV
jgi:hypothetical protein